MNDPCAATSFITLIGYAAIICMALPLIAPFVSKLLRGLLFSFEECKKAIEIMRDKPFNIKDLDRRKPQSDLTT